MPHHTPESAALSLRSSLTRRRLLNSSGAGILSLALGISVSGQDDHRDDHDDDQDGDSGRGRGHGGDEDDVQPVGTVPPGSAEVRIDDDDADGFEPGAITIDVGQSVTWVNVDDDPHTATGAEFDTGRIEPGGQATVTFSNPGRFPYSCQFHPIMTGVVEVRDPSGQVPARSAATPEASPGASPQATPATSGTSSAVSIINIAFDPAELTVPGGTTVTWTNDEAIPHTVTSLDDVFGSDILEQGDTFTYTFDPPGTFEYICNLHPSMQGTITVTDA